MVTVRALVLGGTSEASGLARALAARPDVDVTTSFAGRTSAPVAAAGRTRVGGFGGARGLADHLRSSGVDVLVDATHPFAARMRWHAAEAAGAVGIPRLRLERPPWEPVAGDRWVRVADLDAAAEAVRAGRHARVLLTTGRTELAPFRRCRGARLLVRSIEPPDLGPLTEAGVEAEALVARGPFTVEDEARLLADRSVDAVVSKNSGGDATAAKLVAARRSGLPVIMVDRPPSPPGPRATTVPAALAWLDDTVTRRRARS